MSPISRGPVPRLASSRHVNKVSIYLSIYLSDIAFDCKINMSSWSTSPKTVLITGFVPVRLGNINSDITSHYNINRQSWPSSPDQLSSFEPVTWSIRLGIINSDITSNYDINRPSCPTSPYQLSSFEPVTLPVRLENINLLRHYIKLSYKQDILAYIPISAQALCQLGLGSSTPTCSVNKSQY